MVDEATLVYELTTLAASRRRRNLTSFFFAAAGSLAMVVLGLVALFRAPPGRFSAGPGVLGGLTTLPVFLFYYFWRALREVKYVELRPTEVLLRDGWSDRVVRYADIAEAAILDTSTPQVQDQRSLVLKDPGGRELGRIVHTMEDFAELTDELRRRVAVVVGKPVGDAAGDRAARLAQRVRARRNNLIAGVLLILMMGACAGGLGYLHWQETQLAENAVLTEGKVIQHYVYRVTPRLEYSFTDAAGMEHTRNTSLPQAVWEQYAEGGPVPVRYVAEHPDLNRVMDEPEEAIGHFRYLGYAMFVFAVLMTAFVATGYDLDVTQGKWTLLRPGELIEDRYPHLKSGPG